MKQYIRLMKLLDKKAEHELAIRVSNLVLKKAQQQQHKLENVLKWKYLHRELKQKFELMRELLAGEVDVLGQAAKNAIFQMGYWIKYVDDIQADPIDENPYRTEYTDAIINNGIKWWQTFIDVIKPVEAEIYGKQANNLEDNFKEKYDFIKAGVTRILNNINAITSKARIEFNNYFNSQPNRS